MLPPALLERGDGKTAQTWPLMFSVGPRALENC